MASLVLVFSLLLLVYTAIWNGYHFTKLGIHLNHTHWPLSLCIPPLFYLYLKSKAEITTIDFALHLAFPFIAFICFTPFYFSSLESKIEYFSNGINEISWFNSYIEILQVLVYIQLLCYLFLINNLVDRLSKHIAKPQRNTEVSNWLDKLKWTYVIFVAANFSYLITISLLGWPVHWDYGISLVLAGTIYFAAFKAYDKPELFIERENLVYERKRNNKELLSNEHARVLELKLNAIMLDDKLFLNNQLNLAELANHLNTSTHNLSFLLNQKMNTNFNDYINKFRIEHAQAMLKSPSMSHLTVLAIGYESGFSSKSSFYSAFKKLTGKTPFEFKTKELAV